MASVHASDFDLILELLAWGNMSIRRTSVTEVLFFDL